MLRYLSSYIFQTENEPSDIGDPNSEQLGPSGKVNDQNEIVLQNGGGSTPPTSPIVKGNDEMMEFDGGDNDEEDDWVLIGEENRKKEEQVEQVAKVEEEKKNDPPRLQVHPEVNLVAAPSTEEEDGEDDSEEDSEGEDEVTQDLLWENKLIEHPSMSVYVDLATSISNVASSCVSLSSIAATTSPGESVIVLEQPESDDEEIESSDEDSDDDDVSSMDFVEAVASHEPLPQLQTAEQIHLVEDDDSSDEENHVKISTPKVALPQSTPAPVQNGRRKKGHYPNSSSHSTQMPRRTHLRNSGTSSTTNQSSSNSFINLNGTPDAPHEAIKRMKRSGNSSQNNQSMSQPTCGIAMVNGAPPQVPNGMVKNIKLIDLFPTSGAAAKRRAFPQKCGTTQKGHFLSEGRRRQDLQNYTKRSFVNNDRRSAQQRRAPQQKGAAASGSAGGRGK